MVGIAPEMQLSNPLPLTRIVEYPQRANLVGHQYVFVWELHNLRNGVLSVVATVHIHCLFVDYNPITHPLHIVLNEDRVDSLVLFQLDDA